ncbi:hypothetical protein [Melittangium boletus]|uniref:hypothetical protein n=1 Tax=Melittangium boletus TaxID=83453 RepID=UPI003DA32BBF
MKRLMLPMMVGLGLVWGACTQSAQSQLVAGLQGTYDLSRVNDRLFVTSTDRNELRVLELNPDAQLRRFARAPNPLEPLAIPVLPRPQALTHDVRYDEAGSEQPGPYVYARSNGSTLISVVSAESLREVVRLDTVALTAALPERSVGPVTAIAARAPAAEGEPSILYFATRENTGARLWRVRLPASPEALEALEGAYDVKGFGPSTSALTASEAVSSLLVLPAGRLAVSTLRGETRNPGRSFWLDPEAGGAEQVLDFAGGQVLKLFTHERVAEAEGRAAVAEGTRIFGLLDPSNCAAAPCASGVLAVESATGVVSNDATGYRMLPLNAGAGLPTGLSLSRDTRLSVQPGESRTTVVPLLGIVPLSTGGILFFDALTLQQLNTGATWASPEQANTVSATLSFVDVVGNATDATADLTFSGTFGTTRDETYVLAYQGVFAGMGVLERDPASATFRVPALLDEERLAAVRPGDRIVLLADAAAQQPCGTDVTVGEIQRDSPAVGSDTLVPTGALPEECAGYPFFQVRAAGTQPLVLGGAGEAFIRRMGTGDLFTRSKSYFFHPPNYSGRAEDLAVSIRVLRNLEDTNRPLARGDRYVVGTRSYFAPYLISVDLSYSDLRRFRLPGPVVQARVGDTDFAYIAYPSANGLLQVTLTSLVSGAANAQGLLPYQ